MNWSRNQLLAALNLYHRTPFGYQHSHYPPIVELAELIGRTPSAVAMKLNNFTSLDPAELERGVKGLTGASRADRAIWAEFEGRMNELACQSEAALEGLASHSKKDRNILGEARDSHSPEGQSEAQAIVTLRRHQRFFRNSVLGSYNYRCGLTGNPVPELLRASHIIPWAEDKERRADPRNGILLAATFDAAFDRGLISFDEDLCLMLSPRLENYLPNSEIESLFFSARGRKLTLPEKNIPDPYCLAWHRDRFSFSS